MRSLPELVEFIRVSCKFQNSSITKEENEIGVIFVEWRRVFLRHFSFITRCV